MNLGTYENPFWSLYHALTAAHGDYVLIYLLQGPHQISSMYPNAYLHHMVLSPRLQAMSYSSLHIELKPLYCSSAMHPQCVPNPYVPIQINNLNPHVFSLRGEMRFEGIQFEGSSYLVAGCSTGLCTYCPNVTATGNSYMDDRQKSIAEGTFAQQSVCDSFHAYSFMSIATGANISLKNTQFIGFRQQFGSLIFFSTANISLTNVNFTNIHTFQAVLFSDSSLSSTLQLFNISVQLLNNGFEYTEGRTFAGFLAVQGARKVEIRNSSFAYSVIGVAGSLITVNNFISLHITQCRFSYILGQIVHIKSTVQLPEDLSESAFLYLPLTHFSVSASNFTGISANSLLSLTIQEDLLNVEIHGCRFESDLALTSGLINLSHVQILSEWEMSGGFLAVLNGVSRVRVYFSPNWVNITQTLLTSCSLFGSGLLYIANFPNVKLEEFSVRNSGDLGRMQNLYDVTLKQIAASPGAYMSKNMAGLAVPACNSLIYLESIQGLTIRKSALTGNTCLDGIAGIIGLQVSSVSVSDLEISHTSSKSLQFGSALDLTLLSFSSFVGLKVLSNSNSASNGTGVVRLISATSVISIRQSLFQANSMPINGALQCTGSCVLEDTVFEGNTATGVSAAGLVYSPQPQAYQFSLLRVVFKGNKALLGAALTITDTNATPTKTHLTILSCLFELNSSLRLGSCIHLTSAVTLSDSSVISSTSFLTNTAPQACVFNSFLSGVLLFDECRFAYNSGARYSVLFSNNPASTPTAASRIILQNTLIEWNKAATSVMFSNADSFSEGESRNVTYQHNLGRGFMLQWTYWKEVNSTLFNNSSPDYATGFNFLMTSIGQVNNTQFRNMTAAYNVGALYAGGASVVTIFNATFAYNKAPYSPCILIDQYSLLEMRNSRMIGNVAAITGAAIYAFSGGMTAPCFLYDTVIAYNRAGSGVLNFITSNVTLVRCEVYGNEAGEYPGILAYISAVTLIDTKFHRQKGGKGVFLAAPASNIVRIQGCSFANTQLTDRGAVYISASTLQMSNTDFADLTASHGTALVLQSDTSFSISSSHFHQITTQTAKGGALLISESSGSVEGCSFRDFSNGAIVGQSSAITLRNVNFTDGFSMEGTGMLCSDCRKVVITGTICRYLTANSAPCFSLTTSLAIAQPYSLDSCEITGNRGNFTGAVVVNSANLLLSNSTFTNNSAEAGSGDGGALSLLCNQPYCSVLITNSTFARNSAGRKGGAIVWNRFKPTLSDLTFSNNSALYGNNIASFPVQLAINTLSSTSLSFIPSGQTAETPISVALLDHYGEIVTTDSVSLADLFPVHSSNTSVTGTTRVLAEKGTFEFGSYVITCAPGEATQVKIVTNGIDTGKTEPGAEVATDLVLDVSMRKCLLGESQLANACYPCPEGKYSLDPTEGCQDCPTGAVCLGRAQMVPEAGYWRSAPTTALFWKCPNADACLGSNTTGLLSLTGDCAEGYYGNMCNGCLSGFSRTARAICAKCPDQVINITRIIGVAIAAVLVVAFLIKMSLVSAHKARSHYSIYLKIFVNYLQLVTVTAAFNLAWPSYVLEVFKAQESAGNVSEQVFSFDCFHNSGQLDNQQQVLFIKIVLIVFIPVIIFALSTLFWLLIALFRNNYRCLKYELVNSMVVMFFLAHPSIIRMLFDMFNCREVDPGQFWLNSYLNIRCWDALHYRYAMAAALPGVVLWGICTPAGALVFLVRYRKMLDSVDIRVRLGFLYNGYHAQKYYWEFVILYRKVLIIVFSVFLATVSVSVQALGAMLIFIVAFVMQMKKTPYLTPVLNALELRAILVGAVTIYCGLFFLTTVGDTTSQLALFMVIVAVNTYFLLYWLLKTCKAGCEILLELIPKLRQFFSPRSHAIRPENDPFDLAHKGQGISLMNASPDVSVSASRVSFGQGGDSSLDLGHRSEGGRREPPDNSPASSVTPQEQ